MSLNFIKDDYVSQVRNKILFTPYPSSHVYFPNYDTNQAQNQMENSLPITTSETSMT